jgi:hypothetical protein
VRALDDVGEVDVAVGEEVAGEDGDAVGGSAARASEIEDQGAGVLEELHCRGQARAASRCVGDDGQLDQADVVGQELDAAYAVVLQAELLAERRDELSVAAALLRRFMPEQSQVLVVAGLEQIGGDGRAQRGAEAGLVGALLEPHLQQLGGAGRALGEDVGVGQPLDQAADESGGVDGRVRREFTSLSGRVQLPRR